MKKAIAALSITLLLLVLVGCVDTSATTSTTTTQTTTITTTTTQTTTTTTTELVDLPPVILGADNVTIQKNAGFIPLAGITATDDLDGDLTDDVRYSGNVNPNAVGTYTATYTVTDSAGNVTVVTRTVTVVLTDTQPPLLSGAGNVANLCRRDRLIRSTACKRTTRFPAMSM
ncbi:MAG: DUF5011 domain-containing protein [Bacillus subtilis]|nr:DUF5011 domain-containing protein [Bacillus subtilis]